MPATITLPLTPPEAAGKAVDVVGLGESSVDLVAVVDEHPAANAKLPIRSLTRFVGGQVTTALVACARLGCRARYAGCLGDDAEAEIIIEALGREGVELRVARRRVRSRSAIIVVDRRTGARTVLEYRDPSLVFAAGEISAETVTGGRVLLVDATDAAASRHAAAVARAASIPVVLDIEQALDDREATVALLRSVDVVIAAEAFPGRFTGTPLLGDALRKLEGLSGASLVVATLGAAGSLARCGGIEIRTAGFRVEAVDTTGAGDAFRGGFIAGWLGAARAARADTLLEYANAVAALNCRGFGAQSGLPTRAQVNAFVTTALRGESK
jgi:sugar/nucleoside kinase (ribokinase family)